MQLIVATLPSWSTSIAAMDIPTPDNLLADLMDIIPSGAGLAAALFGALLSAVTAWFGRRSTSSASPDDEPLEVSLAARIDTLRDNLKASNAIVEEITAELNLQMTALDRIRAEAEQNRALAALHKDEADAVAKLMEATIHRAQDQTAKTSKKTQWWFFLAGLAAAIPFGVAGNFVYALMTK